MCLNRQDISTVQISGDSLAREHFQNVMSLLSGSSGKIAPRTHLNFILNSHCQLKATMRKVLLSMDFQVSLSTGRQVRVLFDPDAQVLFYNLKKALRFSVNDTYIGEQYPGKVVVSVDYPNDEIPFQWE